MGDSDEDINFESADEDENADLEKPNEKLKINAQELNQSNVDEDLSNNEKNTWNWTTLTQLGSNVLNQATSSVGAFTSQVGGTLVHALDSVQTGFIGTTDESFDNPNETPESVDNGSSQLDNQEGLSTATKETEGWLSSWGLGSISTVVNSASSVVQQTTQSVGNTGLRMMNTGLDVLETLGKKTYDVVVEGGDLKHAIQKSKHDKPNLSQVLREAKIQADLNIKETEDLQNIAYSYWFDVFNGIAHLEALENLSSLSLKQVKAYLDDIPNDVIDSIKVEQKRIRSIFDDSVHKEDEEQIKHNFNEDLDKYSFDSTIPVTISKLLQNHDEFIGWTYKFENRADNSDTYTIQSVHIEAVKQLASFTVLSIEHLHRISTVLLREPTPTKLDGNGELVEMSVKEYNYVDVANVVTRLALILDHEITDRATQFTASLSALKSDLNESDSKDRITSIYFESANSCHYIQKSLLLVAPILQLAAIKQHKH